MRRRFVERGTDWRDEAIKELKLFFILQKIATEANVDVEEGDLNSRVAMIAAQRGLRPEKLKQTMAKDGTLANLYVTMREQKAVDELLKKVQIEARVIGDLATTYILPASIKYQNVLIQNIQGLKDIGIAESGYVNQKLIVEKISEHIGKISSGVEGMINARKVANEITGTRDRAIAYCDTVKSFFDDIRYHVDKLELLVDDEFWELPKYREMLFLR